MPISSGSTASCSSPENNSVKTVFINDTIRYVRKGYGLIVASLLTFSFFFILPALIKNYIWSCLINLAEKQVTYFFLIFATHEIIFLICNLMMWWIYTSKIPFFERYRINTNKKWPWEENNSEWRRIRAKSFKSLAFSHFAIVPSLLFLDIQNGVKMKISLEEFPSSIEIIFQIFFFMFWEDFTFYWSHRTLHHKRIYPYIHKIHHEYNNPISISSEYAHPLEFLIGNLVPSMIGPKILNTRVHLFTYLLWSTLRILETVDGHCGYEFSWSPYR